jgi:hypothetical protein
VPGDGAALEHHLGAVGRLAESTFEVRRAATRTTLT